MKYLKLKLFQLKFRKKETHPKYEKMSLSCKNQIITMIFEKKNVLLSRLHQRFFLRKLRYYSYLKNSIDHH